ncbi:hypothetical protein BT96DRAFT_1077396 [Gymnopus androsaceus JB14]|uniref:Aminoglycoside phosphotransferase domain-containing protein n=1 Tax=Gymnopus androsaceus JB14 TaxID=1447944 RepID=A0A6A4IHE6_9AGAR|nr:hypothetical protein BT96DRAFT_1077396 [Gymnopus androsaceus JB14]
MIELWDDSESEEEYDSDEYAELHPNLHALSSVVSSALNQKLTKPWTRLTRGLSHEIWVSQTKSNMHLVARLSRTEEDPRKLLSEVSTMRYVKHHTTVPVPTVYLLEENQGNQVGMQYMVMERMPGIPLYKIWDELPIEHQLSLIGNIADILKQLAGLLFTSIGMLDTEFNVQAFYALPNISVKDQMTETRPELDAGLGPFSSTAEYLQAFVQRIRSHAESSAILQCLDDVDVIIQNYCAIRKDSFLCPPFRLIHGDFDGQNILITRSADEKRLPRITAIIDWENSYTGPLYFLYEYPIFIQDVSWSKEHYARNAILRRHFVEQLDAKDWFPRAKCSTLNSFHDAFMLGVELPSWEQLRSIIVGYITKEYKGTGKPYNGRLDWRPDSPVSAAATDLVVYTPTQHSPNLAYL